MTVYRRIPFIRLNNTDSRRRFSVGVKQWRNSRGPWLRISQIKLEGKQCILQSTGCNICSFPSAGYCRYKAGSILLLKHKHVRSRNIKAGDLDLPLLWKTRLSHFMRQLFIFILPNAAPFPRHEKHLRSQDLHNGIRHQRWTWVPGEKGLYLFVPW